MGEDKNVQGKFQKLFIILIIIIGFITTFASGYFLSQLLTLEVNTKTKNTKTTKITPVPTLKISQTVQETTKFLPGKFYFDDTLIIVTKDNPQINLVASITRAEQEKNYVQNTRVSYFDGKDWSRETDSLYINDAAIVSNKLVKSWNINVDPTKVLKQSVSGDITINNSVLSFTTGVLQNEIGMRSLPGYTKFMSNGTGILKVNGIEYEAYIVYTRIYSLNASDIQFYNEPFGLTTDWIVFWDNLGNFYHLDSTSVDKPTPIYQTHSIGITEDSNGTVAKTFDVSVARDTKNPPVDYVVNFEDTVDVTLNIHRKDGLNKAPNGSYVWYIGNAEGTVKKSNGQVINGIGLIEYIHD